MNSSKHRQLMAILTKKGFTADDRHSLVYSFTDGRYTSTRDLNDQEVALLILKLQASDNQRAQLDHQILLREKRAVVLSIAQRVGIHEGTSFSKFNAFMIARSIHKKQLNDYNIDELDQLILQFRGLEANYQRSAQIPGTKAWNASNGFNQISEN